MTTHTHRRTNTNGSPIFRIVVLLLPAVYCSWRAFWFTLQTTWSSSILDFDRDGLSVDNDLWKRLQLQLPLPLLVGPTKAIKDHRLLHDAYQTRNILKDETDCFAFNSRGWLEGPRLGNSNVSDRDYEDMVLTLLTTTTKTTATRILQQQSFCGPQSLFQSISMNATNDDNSAKQQHQQQQQQRRLWTTRLLYLAVHLHQHAPALLEAQHRHDNPHCPQEFANSQIGSFDYECPTAKFLVIAFSKNGIGANLRLAAVPALMVGLATQRVVLFVNDAPVGPDFLRQPWTLASCHRRRDAQCFFRPASPCVVTEHELAEAYQLTRGERRRLFRYGTLPRDHVKDRVLLLHLGSLRPQREPENLRQVLFQLSKTVLERIPIQLPALDGVDGPATAEEVLRLVAPDILWANEEDNSTTTSETTTNATFSYYGANSPVFHSLLLYAMRPNSWAVNLMDTIMSEMFPPDFDPQNTVGLPIRASDKCGVESECLSFSEYVAAAQSLWESEKMNRFSGSNGEEVTIVVTSESKEILRQHVSYAASVQHSNNDSVMSSWSHPRFIWNHRDVAQDTGYLEEVLVSSGNSATVSNFSADEMMLSALSSLRAQLQTRVTQGNCCSNFHLLLKDLLDEGCGATGTSHFQCLQDHKDPAYHICCSWDQSPRCQMRREQQQRQHVQLSIAN